MVGIIYMAINRENGKIYVGQTIHSLESRISKHLRTQGCTHFKSALDKYGAACFHWDIIDSATSREELDSRESWWINYLDSIDNGYNLKQGGASPRWAESTIEKMRKAHSGKKLTDEHKKKIGIAGAGRRRSQESIRKTSEKLRGRHISEEQKEKQRIKMTGRKLTQEHIEKVRAARIGYRHSEEAKKNMSIAQKGRIVTEEARKNISAAGKGRAPWNKGISGYKQPRRCTVLPVVER